MKKSAAAFGLALVLAACSEVPLPPAPPAQPLPPKIALNVRAINLADRSGIQPPNSPYATNHFTPTISEAVKQWASDRLIANGSNGQAIMIIKDASLTAQALPTKSGIDSWFTRQQAVKYVGHADVSIEANGPSGFAIADASASRALTLPENPTPLERQDAYYAMLNGLMKDLGQNLEASLQTHMANFIANTPVYGVTAVPIGDTLSGGTAAQPLPASGSGIMAVPLSAPGNN